MLDIDLAATMPKQALEEFIEILANPYITDLKCLKAFEKLKTRLYDAKSKAFNQVVVYLNRQHIAWGRVI